MPEAVLEKISAAVRDEAGLSRTELSRWVCEWLDWKRPNGELKEMSCRVALLKLHRLGVIELPQPQTASPIKRHAGKPDYVFEGATVEGELTDIGRVSIEVVGKDTSRTWTAMMDSCHYLRSGPLCGAQIRYLIRSERHGILGGLSFSAAAWAVTARDQWIGWDDATRRRNLQKVICNSRFLIMPQVRVPNLASHVLSLSLRQLRGDWQERYGEAPELVETYVERQRFEGTCYKAANWIYAGVTRGRGRQDIRNTYGVSVKDVYLYPLSGEARQRLCEGMAEAGKAQEERAKDWAEEEFGKAELGDERLRKRLIMIARAMYGKPQANIPQACGSRAAAKAAYRFFEHEETTMENLLRPHYESTWKRMQGHPVVLAVQDTTSLNYTTHPDAKGLGVIGSNLDRSIGLIIHDTVAFNTEGTPLGLLDVQCWARDRESFGKKHKRYELPIEQKESNKWLKSFHATAEAQRHCTESTIVSVGDREADIYELFVAASREASGPKVLVRAERDRLLADGQGHLWGRVSEEAAAGIQEIRVPRRKDQPARDAKLEVRFAEVSLKPPKRKEHLPELTLWAISAQEVEAPEGIGPLSWMLLTTLEVKNFEDATEKLAWYTLRWGIEIYHRTLKSGCKIEERQFADVNSIEACLALDMVVAWRIFHLTKLGREVPEAPCTVFFEDAEWKALVAFRTKNVTPPAEPPSLQEAVLMVGGLGGHLGRKNDGPPGIKQMWLGLQRLDDISMTWKIMAEQLAPHLLTPIVSSKDYG